MPHARTPSSARSNPVRPPGNHAPAWWQLARRVAAILAVAVGLQAAAESSAPAPRTYTISRFDLGQASPELLSLAEPLLRSATGPGIPISRLQQVTVELQQLLRSRGFSNTTVTIPRQSLSAGIVRLEIREGNGTASARRPAGPALDLRHFIVEGNTVLSGETLDQILGAAAGTNVPLPTFRNALLNLRRAYATQGYPRARVVAPAQFPAAGRVLIRVDEGEPADGTRPPTPASSPAAPVPGSAPAPAPTKPPAFEVRHYAVDGNTLLRPEIISQVFSNATGDAITLPEIQRALADLQLAYRERGFATVSVLLPRQQITNATVKVQVIEGRLSEVRVTGNRHFSSNNVVRALPSLATNEVLDSRVFQRELDLANQNRDRQIYPTLSPGAEPGTSTLTLRVQDRLPLHGRLEVNNHSTPGTPDWRINSSIQYNNLWQLEHQAGLSYGFTPEAFKREGLVDDLLFNRPLISYLGGYYRLPLGGPVSVADQISVNSAFGYDEATRQYRLPPSGGRPELAIVASRSSSSTGLQLSEPEIVTESPRLTIISQDSGENLSINESAGLRFSTPLAVGDRGRLALSAGIDARRYFLESYNTNNFIITTVVTNAQGSQTIESRASSPQPVRRHDAGYLPLTLVLDYAHTSTNGTFTANLTLGGNVLGDRDEFSALAYSRDARHEFAKANLNLGYEQKVFGGWGLLLRAGGQVATGPLLSTEQFAVGGLSSVRGYFEGDDYGDAGWTASTEIRTPFIAARVPVGRTAQPVWLRGLAFLDAGHRFLTDATDPTDSNQFLLGTGVGISANLNNTFDLRILIGWPLLETLNSEAGVPRASFSLGGQF